MEKISRLLISMVIVGVCSQFVIAKQPIRLSGGTEFTILATPENNLNAWDQIRVSAVYPGGSLNKSIDYVAIGTIWQDIGGTDFVQPDDRVLNKVVSSLSIKLNGPLIPGLEPCQVTMGGLEFAYSPYVLDLTGRLVERNTGRRGCSIDNIIHTKGNASAFVFWDGRPENIVWGCKDVIEIAPSFHLTTLFVDAVKVGNERKQKDLTYLMEINNGGQYTDWYLIWSRNWKGSAEIAQELTYSYCDLIDFKGKAMVFPGLMALNIGYRDFGYRNLLERYDPLYRSEIDKNEYDNRFEAPLDKHMGERGFLLGAETEIIPSENIYIYLAGDYEKIEDRTFITKTNPLPALMNSVSFKSELDVLGIRVQLFNEFRRIANHEELGKYNKLKMDEMHYFGLECSREMKLNQGVPLNCSYRIEKEQWPKVKKPGEILDWVEREFKVRTSLVTGPLTGLEAAVYYLEMPKREEVKRQIGVSMKYRTAYGLTVEGGLAFPNVIEDIEELDDVREKGYYRSPSGYKRNPDNFLRINGKYDF